MDENIDPVLLDSLYGSPELVFIYTVKQTFYSDDEGGDQADSGFVRVRYSVGANSRTRNIQVVEDTLGNARVTDEVRKRAEWAIFRPRYVNGKATITHNVEQRFDIKRSGTGLEISRIHAPVWIKQ